MNKKYSILLICLVVYLAIMGFIMFNNKNKKDSSTATVFIGDSSRWIYSDSKWEKISNKDISDYSWKKYDVYDANGLMGNYYLMKNGNSNRWYIFDDDRNSVDRNGDIIAFGGNLGHDVKDIKITEISDNEFEYVDEVLSDLKVKYSNVDEFTIKRKYLVDLDNDGKEEEFYSISNAFSTLKKSKNFSVIFLRKNNKNIIMYKFIEDTVGDDSFGGCDPGILSVFTLNNEKNPKIIVNCEFYSGTSLYNKLYSYNVNGNKFNSLLTDFYKQ